MGLQATASIRYNGYLGLQIGTGPASNFGATALVVPADGLWHLAAVSVNVIGADIQFFLDGSVVDLLPPGGVPSGSLANPSPLRIGMGNLNNGSDAFKGSIDEVQFFNRALASNEFQSIFNATCYGICDLPPSNTCIWDPIRKIWTDCTN